MFDISSATLRLSARIPPVASKGDMSATSNTTNRLCWLIAFLAALAVNCDALGQSIAPANKPCHREYAKYLKNPEHKAFVVTVGRYPKQSCGMSWGYPTKKAAIDQAFAECGIAARRHKMPVKACRLMAAK